MFAKKLDISAENPKKNRFSYHTNSIPYLNIYYIVGSIPYLNT